MTFAAKQHLKFGNYIKYIDEILHKCDKGIEYCKICPNEFVCTELEKDDFGLESASISDVLAAIQYALNKIPGYVNPDKREELKEHITRYIYEAPIPERDIWEDSIIDILLDDKLANPLYKPKAKIGEVRTAITCDSKMSFAPCLKCLCLENEKMLPDSTTALHHEVTLNSTKLGNQFIQNNHINVTPPHTINHVWYYLERDMTEIIQRCTMNDIGLAAIVCYYSARTKLIIPENIVVTGGLGNENRVSQISFLDSKIETILRELHFIDTIIIPKDSSFSISIPRKVKIIEVDTLKQAIDAAFERAIQ